jgi:predicted CopG family antitoxin
MPREGYSSISVSDEVYEELQKRAEKEHRTVPGTIEHLLEITREA